MYLVIDNDIYLKIVSIHGLKDLAVNELTDGIINNNNDREYVKDLVEDLGKIAKYDCDIDFCKKALYSFGYEIIDLAILKSYLQSVKKYLKENNVNDTEKDNLEIIDKCYDLITKLK